MQANMQTYCDSLAVDSSSVKMMSSIGFHLCSSSCATVREGTRAVRVAASDRSRAFYTTSRERRRCPSELLHLEGGSCLVRKPSLRLYGALSSDEASILVQARTEHCGLNACLFRKNLADSPACECGCGDETVLHVLLHC